ncbi:MAG TPA: hypothetical protein VMR45_03815 [Patescibacteria group bacterium]|nr:hypothetical protein [Patescibacteria group bacterium]
MTSLENTPGDAAGPSLENVGATLSNVIRLAAPEEAAALANNLANLSNNISALVGTGETAGLSQIQSATIEATEHLGRAATALGVAVKSIKDYMEVIGLSTAGSGAGTKASELAQPAALPELSIEKIANELYANTRPAPQKLAELIKQGLTEEMLIDAARASGQNVPCMDLTLIDLETVIPYLELMTDELAKRPGNVRRVFASRGADLLHDYFAIRHPDKSAVLMPASSQLWLRSDAMRDPELAGNFLGAYGFDEASVNDPSIEYEMEDEGFNGTIAKYVDEQLKALYGVSLIDSGRLTTKLISTVSDHRQEASQIMDIDDSEIGPTPKIESWMDGDLKFFPLRGFNSTYRIAVALNLMPRHHDEYTSLARLDDGRVVATAAQLDSRDLAHYQQTVDSNRTRFPDHNGSVVNPVAAAIVQYRVVRAALRRV